MLVHQTHLGWPSKIKIWGMWKSLYNWFEALETLISPFSIVCCFERMARLLFLTCQFAQIYITEIENHFDFNHYNFYHLRHLIHVKWRYFFGRLTMHTGSTQLPSYIFLLHKTVKVLALWHCFDWWKTKWYCCMLPNTAIMIMTAQDRDIGRKAWWTCFSRSVFASHLEEMAVDECSDIWVNVGCVHLGPSLMNTHTHTHTSYWPALGVIFPFTDVTVIPLWERMCSLRSWLLTWQRAWRPSLCGEEMGKAPDSSLSHPLKPSQSSQVDSLINAGRLCVLSYLIPAIQL